jgi:hypothetical protein
VLKATQPCLERCSTTRRISLASVASPRPPTRGEQPERVLRDRDRDDPGDDGQRSDPCARPNGFGTAGPQRLQYRALDNGDFNHSTARILVDAQGRIVGRTSERAGADPVFVKLLKATLASSSL